MTVKYTLPALIAGVMLVGAVQSAWADVTVLSHMTMHSPMMDKMMAGQSKQQIAAMNSMMNSTIYMSGKRLRMENAIMTMIIDGGTQQMIMINPVQHTYSVMPFNPNAMKGMMGGPTAGMPAGAKPAYKITDTGQDVNVLGHKCRHYITDVKMTLPNVGNMTMHNDILAAQDLPGVDFTAMEALTAQYGGKIKGVPLKVTAKTTNSLIGAMTVTQTASSVVTTPIPASKFEVPRGYTKTAQPTMPGMGGMMGH